MVLSRGPRTIQDPLEKPLKCPLMMSICWWWKKEQNNTYTHAFKHTHAHNTVKSEKYSTANPKNPHKSTAQLKCKKGYLLAHNTHTPTDVMYCIHTYINEIYWKIDPLLSNPHLYSDHNKNRNWRKEIYFTWTDADSVYNIYAFVCVCSVEDVYFGRKSNVAFNSLCFSLHLA